MIVIPSTPSSNCLMQPLSLLRQVTSASASVSFMQCVQRPMVGQVRTAWHARVCAAIAGHGPVVDPARLATVRPVSGRCRFVAAAMSAVDCLDSACDRGSPCTIRADTSAGQLRLHDWNSCAECLMMSAPRLVIQNAAARAVHVRRQYAPCPVRTAYRDVPKRRRPASLLHCRAFDSGHHHADRGACRSNCVPQGTLQR